MAISHITDYNYSVSISGTGSVSLDATGVDCVVMYFYFDQPSSVTFNSGAVTFTKYDAVSSNPIFGSVWAAAIPAGSRGVHNLDVVNPSIVFPCGVGFAGVDQTTPVGAHFNTALVAGSGDNAFNITTLNANSWICSGAQNQNGTACTAGTNCTIGGLNSAASSQNINTGYTGPKSAGANVINFVGTNGFLIGGAGVELNVAGGGPGSSNWGPWVAGPNFNRLVQGV